MTLFQQWREFEHPVMKNNVPDYSASAMAAKATALPRWRKRLDAIDPKSWPIEQQNDYKLVKAEMNGLDFNLRVLRPWARDPPSMSTYGPPAVMCRRAKARSPIPRSSSTTIVFRSVPRRRRI